MDAALLAQVADLHGMGVVRAGDQLELAGEGSGITLTNRGRRTVVRELVRGADLHSALLSGLRRAGRSVEEVPESAAAGRDTW